MILICRVVDCHTCIVVIFRTYHSSKSEKSTHNQDLIFGQLNVRWITYALIEIKIHNFSNPYTTKSPSRNCRKLKVSTTHCWGVGLRKLQVSQFGKGWSCRYRISRRAIKELNKENACLAQIFFLHPSHNLATSSNFQSQPLQQNHTYHT